MELIVVSNQAEYSEARKAYRDILDNSHFDIDGGKGLNIVKKVDRLITDYLYKDVSKDTTEKNLCRLCFNEHQAKDITGFFVDHRPGDLYDIENGLNFLSLKNSKELNSHISLIHIKNSVERISVQDPVEVFGKSEVSAFRDASVAAHDQANIRAFNQSVIFALDNSNIIASDHSHVITRDMPYITARDSVIVNANDQAVIIARDQSKITADDNALVFLQNDAVCKATDTARVVARIRNKPDFIKTNVFYILDHPYINGNPATAVNLLIKSADPKDLEGFSKRLAGMGCVDPESTKKVFQSWAMNYSRKEHKSHESDSSWER
jgi:hypothetical protein